MREQRRARKDAGALFDDEHVLGLDLEFVIDGVAVESATSLTRRVETAPRGRLLGRVSCVQKNIGMPARRAVAISFFVGAMARWAKMPQVFA